MEIEFTPELMAKAKQAKSHSELLELAKENGFDISEEKAKVYFEKMNTSGELSDDELNSVSGGCGAADYSADEEFRNMYENKRVTCKYASCPLCGSNNGIVLHVGINHSTLEGWCDVYCCTHRNELIVKTYSPEDDLILL